MKRLLIITSSFPRHDRDLAGHFVRAWCRSLVERGCEIDVLCWRGLKAHSRQICQRLSVRFVPYAWPDAETLFFGSGAPENLSRTPLSGLWALPAACAMMAAAVQACRQNDYDAVVGHWLVPGGLLARVVGAATGLPSFVVGHSGGVHLLDRLPASIGPALTRFITAGPTTVPSTPLRDKLVDCGGSDTVAIAPMGVEEAPAVDNMGDVSDPGDTLRLGFLGRLVPIKGLPVVLRAVEELRDAGLDVELDVVGDGPKRVAWEHSAGDGVRFWGAKYGAEKWRHLRRWDGLVMPSVRRDDGRHEGLPVALLEAASVGTVPLVSGVPGVEAWLAAPRRQTVAAGDIDHWRRAIEWLAAIDDDERRVLEADSAKAVAELVWPAYSQWWKQWLGGCR